MHTYIYMYVSYVYIYIYISFTYRSKLQTYINDIGGYTTGSDP